SLSTIDINGQPIAPNSSPEFSFRKGDVVRLALPGGGGHGDPASRARENIEADLKAGYVTSDGARRDYGYDT
ncbi:MAG: hydantoinase B/oxoprolinase family protein, partial [Alphaproteobacteria bacterium]|nr:hydantoinase B/oxoprolinase family protein [Alphaproteobacteria bacterium]